MPKIRIKRGTLANLPSLDKGELAFTTDEKKIYIGTVAGNFIPADMRQAVYDTDGDGKVNEAELADSVPWSGVTSTPNTLAGYGILDGGVIAVGDVWKTRISPSDNSWVSVCYGNGLFVAIAQTGSGTRVMTSPDGVNWTTRVSAANNQWSSVCYGNGLFVAVGLDGDRVMTSPNGINWTIRLGAPNNQWTSVCYGNGLFVAVSLDGSGDRVMTSTDGINWTGQVSPVDNNWSSVCYGNGLFVAVAKTGIGNRVMTSPDGMIWTIQSTPVNNDWTSVCYGNGVFVAVAETGSGDRVMSSVDGINWVSRTSAADNQWNSVCYGIGTFIAVSDTGTLDRVMISKDGIDWSVSENSVDNDWKSIVYGNGMFVAVSNTGTLDRVMTSGAIETTDMDVALEILGKLKTVDGTGSGLNSDLLQGSLPATTSDIDSIALRDSSGNLTAKSLISNVASGTAPLTVTSTTKVNNLNVDMVDGLHSATASTVSTLAARDASGNLTAKSLISDVADGTAPLTVDSTTKVTNLNVDMVDDLHVSVSGTAGTIAARDGSGNLTANSLVSEVATGTAPLTVASTTEVLNLNSELHAGRKLHQLDQYNMFRSGKDSEGLFTQVDYTRFDNTLFATSILSGGTPPQYTTRTITYYDIDGITPLDTITYALSYDIDGEVTSEVAI